MLRGYLGYLRGLRWPALALLVAGLAALVLIVSTTQAAPPRQAGGPAVPATAGGTGSATPNDVNRVAKQLYCPVCPNTPLNVCQTQACSDWRELIRQKLAAGASDQEIVDYFVAQYGERVLAAPPPQGFNLLIWIIPVAALAAGLAALAVILRSWSSRRQRAGVVAAGTERHAPGPGMPTAELPADYVARIERELQGIRGG
jgi:cytochrome c-type biogenesis protein CcmH